MSKRSQRKSTRPSLPKNDEATVFADNVEWNHHAGAEARIAIMERLIQQNRPRIRFGKRLTEADIARLTGSAEIAAGLAAITDGQEEIVTPAQGFAWREDRHGNWVEDVDIETVTK